MKESIPNQKKIFEKIKAPTVAEQEVASRTQATQQSSIIVSNSHTSLPASFAPVASSHVVQHTKHWSNLTENTSSNYGNEVRVKCAEGVQE